MAESCIYIPTIKVGNQEVESQLFRELVNYTGNRESAKFIWGLTRVPEFMNTLQNIQKDKNGEPTLDSLIKAVDITDLLGEEISLEGAKKELNAVNKNGEPIIHSSLDEILNSVIEFNKKHPSMVANIGSKDGGYVISVVPKTSQNSSAPEELIFNSSLNNQLRNILRRLGFDVELLDSPKFKAMFSPENAKTNAEGLRTVIQITKGKIGEEAFPEEFSHVIIEGLINQPIVQRLVKSMGSYETIKAVLGEKFDAYVNLYNGDMTSLQKEAAGQLLQKYITGEAMPVSRPSLLERLWNWVKSKFSTMSEEDVANILIQANRDASQLAESVLDESILPLVDKNLVVNAKTLYRAERNISGMEELAQKALELESNRLRIIQLRSKNGRYSEEDLAAIKNLQSLIEKKKYSKSCLAFLSDSLQQLEQLNFNLSKLDAGNLDGETDLNRIRKISSTLRKIKEFSTAYEPIIKQMMSIDAMKERGEVNLSDEDAASIADKATSVFRIINKINSSYKSLRFNTLYNFLKLYWGEDKVVNIGKDKGNRITLEMIMKMADKDINGIDRWISAMSSASDPMLSLIDKVVKTTQLKRDTILEGVLADVRAAHTKLAKAGYTTDFMYERDSKGNLTGRIISDIDFVKFYEDYNAEKQRLINEKLPYYVVKSKLDAWERRHTEPQVVDAESGRKENIPKKEFYGIDRISKLAPAQREYYNSMISLKAILDSLIPARYANTYKAVQIRNDVTEAVMDNITNPKKASKLVIDNLKDKFIRRSDDTDWGDTTVLNDDGFSILEKTKKVELDFAGNPLQKLPVYYTNTLEDMSRLSTDFTSSIMAYAAMAINYNEMNKVIDVLELARDLVKSEDRKVQQKSGDSKLMDAYTVVHNKFSKSYAKRGELTNIGERIDDYYASVIYNQHKKDEGTWNIFGVEVDKAKALDALKDYTGVLGLGLNLFSGISNVTMGKMQIFIDAMSGEFFNMKDAAVGMKNYYTLLPQYMAELNSTNKTSKLGLLIDKFDALEEFYGELKSKGYYKGPLSRIMGSTNLFFLNNMGEHYLHSRTMLAMLNNIKVKDKEGKEISLFEAFEVKQDKDGVAKLILKEGTTNLNGELLSTEGLDSNSANYSEVDNRYNSFISEQKLRIGKVNQALNGAFNDTDKGAIHKYALGRLAMQFRQWMPAHYSRRFSSASYDSRLDQWREGYYRTLGRFTINLMKDISRGKFELATNWNSLNTTEKANIKRAMTELISFGVIAALISMIGPEKDKKGKWGERMVVYQLKRLQLETGASIPWFSALENASTILQSPAAAINSFNNLLEVVQVWNMFDEIESGRYKGWSEWERDFANAVPLLGQLRKVKDITDEDYMFTIFTDR